MQPSDLTYLTHEIKAPNPTMSSGGAATAAARGLASTISVGCVRFRPYEDVLCAGHSYGLSTIIVPGAGEPNFDSFEANPFMNPKQRQEAEVQTLLQKLSPDMIALDASFVGTVDKVRLVSASPRSHTCDSLRGCPLFRARLHTLLSTFLPSFLGRHQDQATLKTEHDALFHAANEAIMKKEKNKKRGRNKISAKLRRKQKNVVDAQTVKLKEKLTQERDEKANQKALAETGKPLRKSLAEEYGVLARFVKKK